MPAFLAGLLAAALYYMPLSPSLISAMNVGCQAQNTQETHLLNQDESRQFIAALQGPTAVKMPQNIIAGYDIALQLNLLLPRRYGVFVTAEREVYLQRAPGNRLIRSENARFFYTHAAFQNLYPFAQMPEVYIKAQEEVTPLVHERSWQYLRWDDSWHHSLMPPLGAPAAAWPVLKAAENGLVFVADPLPDQVSLRVTDTTGKIFFADTLACTQLPTFRLNGLYNYELSLSWQNEDRPYRGQYEAAFSLFLEQPPRFELPKTIVQGELAAFYIHHLPPGALPLLALPEMDYQFQYFPQADGCVTYLPTHYGTPPGEYRLVYGLEGGPLEESTLVVLPRDFHIQHLSVDARIVATTRNEAAYAQFSRYFPKSRESSAPEPYYSQPFMLPVSGRLTTEFGQTRYVNNAPTSYRHSGLDIAAPTGTPVLAANNGRVTLSMDLMLTGNTVVIDHGQGLFSVYYHMHDIFVQEGQSVQRGDTIGTVGSTGFSTGPHLHFTMSYYKHNLEPGYFLVGEPITFENATRHLQGR